MKNKHPIISVIVPVYNVEDYVGRCIESILSQTYKNLEIIAVNDGSKDKSPEIVKHYSNLDSRIRVINQLNKGLSEARNAGIKASTGEFIAFVDSDDFIDKNFIETLYDNASLHDADISTCRFKPFNESKIKMKTQPPWTNKSLSGVESAVEILKHGRPAYIWLSIFKRSLFIERNISFPQGKTYEDIATRFKLQYYARKEVFTNKKLYNYLIREDSITGVSFSHTRFNDLVYAVEEVKKFSYENNIAGPGLIEFFSFRSNLLLLNYLSREGLKYTHSKSYWKKTLNRMIHSFKYSSFSSFKSRATYTLLYLIAHHRPTYITLHKLKGVLK